jgi:hypothetical protein
VIDILDARSIALHSTARARILDERDPETLARWTVRAVTCADLAALFDASSSR